MFDDCYCINCGCRPMVYHMRDQHEPDGLQPWRGPTDVLLINGDLRGDIQAAPIRTRAALAAVRP
jgi:hypothetical protein